MRESLHLKNSQHGYPRCLHLVRRAQVCRCKWRRHSTTKILSHLRRPMARRRFARQRRKRRLLQRQRRRQAAINLSKATSNHHLARRHRVALASGVWTFRHGSLWAIRRRLLVALLRPRCEIVRGKCRTLAAPRKIFWEMGEQRRRARRPRTRKRHLRSQATRRRTAELRTEQGRRTGWATLQYDTKQMIKC